MIIKQNAVKHDQSSTMLASFLQQLEKILKLWECDQNVLASSRNVCVMVTV